MKFFRKNLFTFVVLVFTIFFIWIILKDFEIEKIKQGFFNANYFLIFVTFIITILSYVFRAVRWNILFEPMGVRTSFSSAFHSIAVGYFFNLGIPRSGEVVRATTLYKIQGIPVEKSFATIVLERIVDLIFLLLFIGFNIIFNQDIFSEFINMGDFNSKLSSINVLYLIVFFAVLCVVIFVILKFRHKIKFLQKIVQFFRNFIDGLMSIFKLKKKGKFVLYSIAIWVCYFLMTYLLLLAFKETETFSPQLGAFILVAGSFGLIFPAAGGLGYPIAMGFAFAALYVSQGNSMEEGKTIGYFYGLFSLFLQYVVTILLGVLGLYYVNKNTLYHL